MEIMESQERLETSCQFKIQFNPDKYLEGFKRDLLSEPRATTPAIHCPRYSIAMAKIVPPINFGLVEDGKLFDPEQS
jgi:hypothetical protein